MARDKDKVEIEATVPLAFNMGCFYLSLAAMKVPLLLLLFVAFFAAGCGREDFDIDLLIGSYRWEGSQESWRAGGYGNDTTISITDTSILTRVNDSTLLCRGYELIFYTHSPGPVTVTPDTYTFFAWLNGPLPHTYAYVKFNKPTNDSASYYYTTYALGGGTRILLKGVKI